jgi:hypothetical protein
LKAEYIDHMGNDSSVVNAARVSFANAGDDKRTPAQNARLINYLAKHNHWTPFAHTQITVQRSNMSKLGADGLPIYREDGKVLKGPNFSPPDIAKVLRCYS